MNRKIRFIHGIKECTPLSFLFLFSLTSLWLINLFDNGTMFICIYIASYIVRRLSHVCNWGIRYFTGLGAIWKKSKNVKHNRPRPRNYYNYFVSYFLNTLSKVPLLQWRVDIELGFHPWGSPNILKYFES